MDLFIALSLFIYFQLKIEIFNMFTLKIHIWIVSVCQRNDLNEKAFCIHASLLPASASFIISSCFFTLFCRGFFSLLYLCSRKIAQRRYWCYLLRGCLTHLQLGTRGSPTEQLRGARVIFSAKSLYGLIKRNISHVQSLLLMIAMPILMVLAHVVQQVLVFFFFSFFFLF